MALSAALGCRLQMFTRDFSIGNGDAFLLEHFLFPGEAASVAGEFAVGADDAVAGNGRGVGVFVEGVADSAVAAGAEFAGDVGVSEHLAFGNAGGQGPDFLVEGHLRRNLAGVNGGFDFGHERIVAGLGAARQVTITIAPGLVQY